MMTFGDLLFVLLTTDTVGTMLEVNAADTVLT